MTAQDTVMPTSRMQEKARDWSNALVDLSARNTLLRYRSTKTATLDLTQADPDALEQLLIGRKVRLRALFKDPAAYNDARTRARSLQRKFTLLEEEQGLDVGRLACGFLELELGTPKPAGKVALRAPLMLRPVKLKAEGSGDTDFGIELGEDPEPNPVLLYALQQDYGLDELTAVRMKIDNLLEEKVGILDQMVAVFELLQQELDRVHHTAKLLEQIIIGAFSFEKLAMVDDLTSSAEQLAQHEIIAALAGHEPAETALRTSAEPYFPGPDGISPETEFLVLDADSSQHEAIHAVLSGAHAVIEGPPGTGKSQTIANLIAELAARGKRVLFVAEKRAAIEAVTDRLKDDRVGLGHLVFDLHDNKMTKKAIAEQLAESLHRAETQPEPHAGDLYRRLAVRRDELNSYVGELHAWRDPWGVTFHEALLELSAMPSRPEGVPRLSRSVLKRFDPRTRGDVEDMIAKFIRGGGWEWLRGESVWSSVKTADQQTCENIVAKLDDLAGGELRSTQSELHVLLDRAGLRVPEKFTEWQDVLDLLDRVKASVERFGKDVFGPVLDDWQYAVAPGQWRREVARNIGFWNRRRLVREIRRARVDGRRDRGALFEDLSAAVRQREEWRARTIDGRDPNAMEGLERVVQRYGQVRTTLAAIAAFGKLDDLGSAPAEEVIGAVDRMADEREQVFKLPDLTRFARAFEVLGLGPLMEALARRNATVADATQEFRRAWLSAFIDQMRLSVRVLGSFTGDQQKHLVETFCEFEHKHQQLNVARVRHAVARSQRKAQDSYPGQAEEVRKQAKKKKGHLPLRRLVEAAPDVLLALHPCWAMSPLVVSRVLPARQLFDVVIFDEGSQVPPEEAVTSIMRGMQIVVAGDEKQLPPTDVFQRMLDDGESDDGQDGLDEFESILGVLAARLPRRHRLTWHYRSEDERLIAFSNDSFYGGELVTFPGKGETAPIQLQLVDGVALPGSGGSAAEEVEAVVSLVLDHAQNAPKESLGVIAFGANHAERIEAALRSARRERPDLDGFFSAEADVKKRFFVKNIETVQGDERDVIVLSLGYAKNSAGSLNRNFGTLNRVGGERRLNVAVTRARRRMCVVSSISYGDLDPAGLKNDGVKQLRKFLETAAHGGDMSSVGESQRRELNLFEQGVLSALEAAGIPVYPQWGVSGYCIDFALAHPDRPGEFVLAVEADGASYHSRRSVRDRDRLRQEHLERLGWRFHRLWSTAWFADPEREIQKIVDAWKLACESEPVQNEQPRPLPRPWDVKGGEDSIAAARGPRPQIPSYRSIDEFTDAELDALFDWLLRDRLEVPGDQRVAQAMKELGFSRRGSKIVSRLSSALVRAQARRDRMNGREAV